MSQTPPKRPDTTLALSITKDLPRDSLPAEIKSRIVSYLTPRQAIPLACVNSTWQVFAETRTWSCIRSSAPKQALAECCPATPDQRRMREGWEALLQAIQRRPDRVSLVKHFTLRADHETDKELRSVMILLAPRLESLRTEDPCCDCPWDHTHPAVGPDYVDRLRVLPQLRVLQLCVNSTNWQEAVLRAVRSTPALLSLDVHSTCNPEIDPSPLPDLLLPVELPCLKRLRISGPHLGSLASQLASHVERLELEDTDEAPISIWEMDAFTDNTFIRHVDDGTLYRPLPDPTYTSWLPNLESLSLYGAWGRDSCIHSTVKHIRYYEAFDDLEIAILPTDTYTGTIVAWITEEARANPGLIQLVEALDEDASTDDWWLNHRRGIHLLSFEGPTSAETLYHARLDFSQDWMKGLFQHWPHGVSQMQALLDWRWQSGNMTACDFCDDHRHLRWIDLTSYRGRPLPHTLLREIYQLTGLSPEWKEGQRDVKMSTEAAEALKEWADSQEWPASDTEEDTGDGSSN